MVHETMATRPVFHLSHSEREVLIDLLWNYEDRLTRYTDRYADMLRGARFSQDDDPLTKTSIAWSDPTGNQVAIIDADEQLCDLRRAILPVQDFLAFTSPRLVRVAHYAYIDGGTRTSGAYVIAARACVSRATLFRAKQAVLEALAPFAVRRAVNLRLRETLAS